MLLKPMEARTCTAITSLMNGASGRIFAHPTPRIPEIVRKQNLYPSNHEPIKSPPKTGSELSKKAHISNPALATNNPIRVVL